MAFHYANGILTCEQLPLEEIAAAVGTPVYVYSRTLLRERARAFVDAAPDSALVCFATKANSNLTLLRELAAAGCGADVTSGGELFLALKAGFPPEKIIFSGVGKTNGEIEMALESGIAALHVESPAELAVVGDIAAAHSQVAPIGLRLNPNIRAETHSYISTGLDTHKFGIGIETGLDLFREAAAHPNLIPVGVAAHIGSQIRDLEPFAETARLLADLASELKGINLPLRYIDVGGGLGIDYERWRPDQEAHGRDRIAAWVSAVASPVTAAGFDLVVEPGRAIIAPAGSLVATVIFAKDRPEKRFIITDTGMNDLLRPTLYQAYHPLLPLGEPAEDVSLEPVDVVGPICESGDFLAQGRPLPPLERGDRLAIMNAGAYGFAMSSNYNGRPRPAEVLVDGQSFQVIRARQSYADLLSSPG